MKHSLTIRSINSYKPLLDKHEDEIDLIELFFILLNGKWIILSFSVIFAFITYQITSHHVALYQADVLLVDREHQSADLLGLKELTGFKLNTEHKIEARIALEMMKSRSFIAAFIKKYQLAVPIAAANGWNRQENKLLYDPNIYDEQQNKWVRDLTLFKTLAPSDFELYKIFINQLFFVEEGFDSNFYTLSIKHYSPFVAKDIVEKLVFEINFQMRKRAIEESQRNLDYLEEQLAKTSVAEMQVSLYSLITEQTKTLMLAEAKEQYVFEVLDPAVVPEDSLPSKQVFTVALAAILGFIFGAILTLFTYYFKKRKN